MMAMDDRAGNPGQVVLPTRANGNHVLQGCGEKKKIVLGAYLGRHAPMHILFLKRGFGLLECGYIC